MRQYVAICRTVFPAQKPRFRNFLLLVPQALKSLFALILQIGPKSGVLILDILSGMNIGRNGNWSVWDVTRVV